MTEFDYDPVPITQDHTLAFYRYFRAKYGKDIMFDREDLAHLMGANLEMRFRLLEMDIEHIKLTLNELLEHILIKGLLRAEDMR